MCGIIGKVSNLDSSRIEHTVNSLLHRGPDTQGYTCVYSLGKKVEFGHTRLAIIDLSSNGSQPMKSKDERWLVSYNGEIYNHKELRLELNVQYDGDSDTETLVQAISAWGIGKTLEKLNGMFAFAAYDRKCNKVYLARDPFGIKPVYYYHKNEEFNFSSEIRGLKALGIDNSVIDEISLQSFLTLRYVPSPSTLFKGINRLQPGHILCYDIIKNEIDISCYVKPTSEMFSGNIDDAVCAYTESLKLAVQRQLLSDVPVGVLLSGGIDSSLIAAMAAETGKKLPCFTVGFGKDYRDCEITDASHTAKILGMDHRFVQVSSDDLWSAFPEVVHSVEEPLGTTSILPMWHLVKKVREEVSVVMTGQGNDEPWGGYRRYQAEVWRKYFPFPFMFRGISKISSAYDNLPDFAERALRSLSENRISGRFEEAYALFSSEERLSLIGDYSNGNANSDIIYWLNWLGSHKMQSAEKMMAIDTRMNLADDLLLYGDKTSMAVSLETRVPMLDIELVKLVESFPLSYKLKLNKTKIVHRLSAERYLPKQIINRPKKNFQVPFAEWAKGEWRERIESVLLDRNAPYLSVLNYDGVLKIWNEHLSGKRDRTRQLFALLSFAFCIKDR